jgi:D-alanine-D-alanine ligase
MKIALLAGADSPEREVSLATGAAVGLALSALGHEVVPIDPGVNLPFVLFNLQPDFVWIALHGHTGENGVLQGLLDWLGLPYNGSGVSSSALCMDKVLTKKLLLHHHIPTPAAWMGSSLLEVDLWEKLGSPLVVKPAQAGSAVGVSIVRTPEELAIAWDLARQFSKEVVIESYIPGQEVTVTVIDDQVFPIIEILPQGHAFYTYDAKYAPGGSRHQIPPNLAPEIIANLEAIALGTYQALGCQGLARVDLRVDPLGACFVLECNTLPGMTDTSLAPEACAAQGLNFVALIALLLEKGLARLG